MIIINEQMTKEIESSSTQMNRICNGIRDHIVEDRFIH